MWLCILYLTGVASPYLMLRDPTRREMKEYLHHLTFGAKGELLNSFQQLQQEKVLPYSSNNLPDVTFKINGIRSNSPEMLWN